MAPVSGAPLTAPGVDHMNRFVCVAATAAMTLLAAPAAAEETFTPPPGYVLVPAPPPGYALEPVAVERTWVVGASTGPAFGLSYRGLGSTSGSGSSAHLGGYVDFFLSPRVSLGLFADRMSVGDWSPEITSVGASMTGHLFGGARTLRLRGGLGLSSELRSEGPSPGGVGARVFLGLVVPVSRRAALFLQATARASSVDTVHAFGSLDVGLELGN